MRLPSARLHVCVFAKLPRAGKVKTRLASHLGARGAAELAEAFLTDSWQMVRALPWARPVLALDSTPPIALRGLDLGDGAAVWQQGEGDLGQRIERVARRALDASTCMLAIGADTPGLPVRLLEQARAMLCAPHAADAVLGPAADGGFYLLGLRRCPEGLLKGLPWSAEDTFARTLERLRQRGMQVHVLDPWFDVDRPTDIETLRARLARGEIVAPATARALARTAPRISVVIPTLNEEKRIGARLRELSDIACIHEVVVVDGGSEDATVMIARGFPRAHVLEAPRGRARQLNAGAAAASGEILLFAHADTSLPADAAHRVYSTLAESGVIAGAFRTWTVDDTDERREPPWLHLADLRSRITSTPYGDQALFMRASDFRRVGGYPEQALMEDFELSRRLHRLGRIQTVAASVRVSGRRFLARPLYYFAVMNLYPWLYRLGVPPHVLARAYRDPR